jgi:ribosomal protein S18 acetylase RimI-like enzyme
VHHLAVSDASRREHLASRLVAQSLNALESIGIGKCHAFVFHDNPYAELFWEAAGWERRNDLVVLSKTVTPGGDTQGS